MFRNARLPTEIAYGFSSGPEFATDVFTSPGGWESRRAHWPLNRGRWEISFTNRTTPQIALLLDFFRSVAVGRAYSFRFKDFNDYTFANVIGLGDGTTRSFPLFKTYTSGQATFQRLLTKPVTQTIRVAINGVYTDAFVVAPNTGILTFDVAPSVGAILLALGEFDCAVRFASDTLTLTAVDPGPSGIGLFSAERIELLEIVNEEEEPTETWKLVYREAFDYPVQFVAWTGVPGEPHEPMNEHFDTGFSQWNARISGFSLGQVIEVQAGWLHMERTGYQTTLIGIGGQNVVSLIPKHPIKAYVSWPAASFYADNNDLQFLMRLNAPPTNYPTATGSHWTSIPLGSSYDPPTVSGGIRSYALQLESVVNTGAIRHWRFGYPTSGGGFSVLLEADITIAPSTMLAFRITTRNASVRSDMLDIRVYLGVGRADFLNLPLLFGFTNRRGDRQWGGYPASTLLEWQSPLAEISTFIVEYDEMAITGYETVSGGDYMAQWDPAGDTIMLQDQWTHLVGTGGLLFRLDWYRTPGTQVACLRRRNRARQYVEGRLRALWKVQQNSGTGLAYWGLYYLATGQADALNWPALGLLVEFNQATGLYTRVLAVQWTSFRTGFTILDQAPLSHPMSTPVAMELEWHRKTGADPVSYLCRLGSSLSYGDLTLALQGEIANPFGSGSAGEGPVLQFPYDGSPTATLDLALDQVELDEVIELTIVG